MTNTIEKKAPSIEISKKNSPEIGTLNIDKAAQISKSLSAIQALLKMKERQTQLLQNKVLEAELQERAKKETRKYYTSLFCANLKRV